MKTFAELYAGLDQTTKTNEKVLALIDYFNLTAPEDSIWAIALLTGRRPKRPIRPGQMREWAAELAGVPAWLFEESYAVVGDLSETISLLVPANPRKENKSLNEIMREIITLEKKTDSEKREWLLSSWAGLSPEELFVFNKLIGGSFRVGVSQQLVFKALAKTTGIEERIISHRLTGNWLPQNSTLDNLLISADGETDHSKPYPFFLAYQLDVPPEQLGDISEWQIERKYDGIRGQIIVRNGEMHTWSRGEELMSEKFIEFSSLGKILPDGTVIDGEVVPIKNGNILSFNEMQKRIGRKNLSKKILHDVPLCMMCYDLIEYERKDVRQLPLKERRAMLEKLVRGAENEILQLSPLLHCENWGDLDLLRKESKSLGCEGLMLKRRDSIYETGRRRGSWWKWKVDPFTVDAVLIYAQAGHGRRANLYTDYTFAVWDHEELVPFAKAYSGLTDKEISEVDRWIRRNTLEKFGPVRSVKAELVFEIAFEGINISSRHKSGIALRFPRILRWRKDKTKEEANKKEDLLQLLNSV